jgi:AICAR transformylase/IMP cyclohydrolase PurH
MAVIKQALISVSDKTGIAEFARGLSRYGITLISTGGTARLLRDAGIAVIEAGDYTGFPEMLDGRVKTLHPRIHAGILARRDVAAHIAALGAAGIPTIDLVVVNLYPFGETIARPDCALADAIENIDIGGHSGAPEYHHVAVVTTDYPAAAGDGPATQGERPGSRKAFSHTAAADSKYLTSLIHGNRLSHYLNLHLTSLRPCAMARIRTRARRFTATAGPSRAAWATFASCRARSCPTTILPMPMRPGSVSGPSSKRRASS